MTKNYKPEKKLADLDLNSELKQFDLISASKRRKAISVADYRSERGEVVAALLEKYAADAGNDTCLAYAERLRACADKNNFYLGDDFVDFKTGETFSGFGTLFGCGLKLCQSCTARAASRNRAIAIRAIENTELLNREHECYFEAQKEYQTSGDPTLLFDKAERKFIIEQEELRAVTLTMPEVFASVLLTLKIQRRAWDLFRKLKFTKTYLTSLIKSGEFTVRENGTYHVHLHLLAASFYLPGDLLKYYWTNCVRTAFDEFGFEFKIENLLNAHFERIYDIDGALKEVCKYITKTDSWEEIPAEHLLEIAEVKRWDRMFEASGNFRKTLSRLKAEETAAAAVLSSSVNKQETLTEAVARELNYFNTDGITDGELSETSEIHEDRKVISTEKPKRQSWRDLVEEVGLENYLEIFNRQVEYAQKIRKLRLVIKYPDAKFSDLAGNAWNLVEIEEFAQQLALRGADLGI